MSEHGPSASSDVSEGVRGTKRRRTAQACGPCRVKKTKCDGLQPACTTCKELGYECAYTLDSRGPTVSNVTVSKASLQAILDRLQNLEQTFASGPDGRDSPSRADRLRDQTLAEEQSSFMVEDLFRDADPTGGLLSLGQVQHVPQQDMVLSQSFGGGTVTSTRPPPQHALPTAVPGGQMDPSQAQPAQPHEASGAIRRGKIHDLEPVASQSHNAAGASHHRESPATPALDGMGLLPPVNMSGTQLAAGTDPSPTDTGDRLDKEVYGPTSGIHFHSLLLDTLLPGYRCIVTPQDLCGFPPSDFDGDVLGGKGSKVHPVVRLDDLPDLMQAEIMWDFFFTRTYPLYPFFSEKAVRASYEQLLDRLQQRPSFGRQTVWHSAQELLAEREIQPVMALHFSIFGLVQALSNSGDDRTLTRIALKLQRNHMYWPHSVHKGSVDVLLLGTMLMQGLDSPSQGWDILGYAIRSACAVGLHDPSNSKALPPEEQEIRCRVWWGCFIFDQLLTVTIGRPSAITTTMSRMPLPSPLPDENANAIQFFLESIRLYTAFSAVAVNPTPLKSINKTDAKSSPGSIQSVTLSIYQIEREYAIWSDGIEPGLNINLDEPMGPLAHVLALRGLTMRLLLHRPVLLLAIRERYGMQSRPPSPIADASRCRGSALRALESTQRHLAFGVTTAAVIDTSILTIRLLQSGAAGPDSRSAPWYQLFYAMNAFMSLVGALMLDLTTSSSIIKKPASEISSSLYAVKDIVGLIEKTFHRPSALRALAIVDQLLKSLGLQADLGEPANAPAGDASATVIDPAANAVDDTGGALATQAGLEGFQDLPQFDLAGLQQTFGLGMLDVTDDNPLLSDNWGDLFMWQ